MRAYVAHSAFGFYTIFSYNPFNEELFLEGDVPMKSENDVKKVEGERREVKKEEKRPYAKPELTNYGVVERFTGGSFS